MIDGTLCQAESPKPGSLGLSISAVWHSVTKAADSDYHWLKTKAHGAYNYVSHGVRSDLVGALCIYRACTGAQVYAGQAIMEETNINLAKILFGIASGSAVDNRSRRRPVHPGCGNRSTVANAAGAVVGADLGFDVGMAALTWIGIGFLAKSIVDGFGELVETALGELDGPGRQGTCQDRLGDIRLSEHPQNSQIQRES